MMGRPADTRLTPSIAREICERTGSAAALNGSIAQIGSQYLLTLKAVNCLSGDSLASAEPQASDKNHVLEALGKTASEIRKKLGESLSTVQKLNTPIEQATTPSLVAFKAFTDGQKVLAQTREAAAIPFFKHAVELDQDFALAYAYLGITHTTIGEPDIGAAYTRKAFGLRQRTSEPENYFISATYFKEVTGNLKTAEQTCTLWGHAYPRSEKPHVYLSGAIFPQIGLYEKAIEEGKVAVGLNPDSPVPYAFLMFGYTGSNRFDDAKAVYRQVSSVSWTSKRLTNTPVRRAGSVLKCPGDRKNRVVSAQTTYPCGSSAVGGRVCEQRHAPERVLPESRFELQHAGSPSKETALEEKA